MKYLNGNDIKNIGINWYETIGRIEDTLKLINDNDCSQPLKPYLRFGNLENRIIAMPAFVGGGINMAGIKWIASFPNNSSINIPRAHSVIILNNAKTGIPECIINTTLLSEIRTASVSGLMVKHYLNRNSFPKIKVGIIGFGPIGQIHFDMCRILLDKTFCDIFVYDHDKNKINNNSKQLYYPNVHIANSWEEAYVNSDILITCTVSKERYIDIQPKCGSLHLNVSLRDYKLECFNYFKDFIVVDNWLEICRENTDIHNFSINCNLKEEAVFTMYDYIFNDKQINCDTKYPIFFNPMGMGVFDISIASYFYDKSKMMLIGTNL